MERWLSKSRVLIGLSAVLLVAALNRHDGMLYRMFLFMATLCALGYVLPWLSLRSLRMTLEAGRQIEVTEGAPLALGILVEKASRWPAFMVDVQTEWTCSGRTTVLRETIGVIRQGQTADLSHRMTLDCRGEYVLTAARLTCGFPLGLMQATHTLARPDLRVLVLPRPLETHWPLAWDVTEDHRGELSTRRLGQSLEPGVLRPYTQGEPVGRVSWGASARAGELIIQHFQQPGVQRLRVVVDRPAQAELGDAGSAGEQAIRRAAGLVLGSVQQGVQTFTYVPDQPEPVPQTASLLQALACVRAGSTALPRLLARVAADARPGEQVALVVSAATAAGPLLAMLDRTRLHGVQVVVFVAQRRQAGLQDQTQALALRGVLEAAGWRVHGDAP